MSENRIVFATGNAGKMKEIRLILADLGMEILSMKEAGADPVIVENGKTFGENAEITARAVWAETGGIVLADDSGLVVDCLGGEPGIYSARYMGEDTSYEIKNRPLSPGLMRRRGTTEAPGLSVISRPFCRMGVSFIRRRPWRESSQRRPQETAALDTIQSCFYRSSE